MEDYISALLLASWLFNELQQRSKLTAEEKKNVLDAAANNATVKEAEEYIKYMKSDKIKTSTKEDIEKRRKFMLEKFFTKERRKVTDNRETAKYVIVFDQLVTEEVHARLGPLTRVAVGAIKEFWNNLSTNKKKAIEKHTPFSMHPKRSKGNDITFNLDKSVLNAQSGFFASLFRHPQLHISEGLPDITQFDFKILITAARKFFFIFPQPLKNKEEQQATVATPLKKEDWMKEVAETIYNKEKLTEYTWVEDKPSLHMVKTFWKKYKKEHRFLLQLEATKDFVVQINLKTVLFYILHLQDGTVDKLVNNKKTTKKRKKTKKGNGCRRKGERKRRYHGCRRKGKRETRYYGCRRKEGYKKEM